MSNMKKNVTNEQKKLLTVGKIAWKSADSSLEISGGMTNIHPQPPPENLMGNKIEYKRKILLEMTKPT